MWNSAGKSVGKISHAVLDPESNEGMTTIFIKSDAG